MNDQTPAVGERIKFDPQIGNRWWTVRARDGRYIVATQQRPFHPAEELLYTVVDTQFPGGRSSFGLVPEGMARSSLNTIGGGALSNITTDSGCREVLTVMQTGEFELSHRRIVAVQEIVREKS